MRSKFILTAIAALPLLASSQTKLVSTSHEVRWTQDIEAFAQALSARGTSIDFKHGISSRGQLDFELLYPHERFDHDIATLKANLAARTDSEIVLELMRILASAHVAHNSLVIPETMGFEKRLPFWFVWLQDGPVISYAAPTYKTLLGERLLKIGSRTPEEIRSALAPYVSNEVDVGLGDSTLGLMILQPVLEHLGIIDADGQATLTLEARDNRTHTIQVQFVNVHDPLINFYEGLGTPLALRHTHLEKHYWYSYLADSAAAYIQYSLCVNDRDQTFKDFVRATIQDINQREIRSIIIDLRSNRGGDSRIISPLLDALAEQHQRDGHLYVLIGPGTLSSGLLAALDLKTKLHAVLIGAPSAEKPSHYGEVKEFSLPNSGLVIQYSTKHFSAPPGISPDILQPDIPAAITRDDLLSGRDPALLAAIKTH